jgi:hypothetical protein
MDVMCQPLSLTLKHLYINQEHTTFSYILCMPWHTSSVHDTVVVHAIICDEATTA